MNIDYFQQRLFTFFGNGPLPLLGVSDIETLMTECFKYLLSKNKHKGHISKRTVKKVVFRQCPSLLLRALAVLQNPNNTKKD